MCIYASHACLVPCRGQKSVLDPLKLKLYRYATMRMLRIEARSSGRAVCALDHPAKFQPRAFKCTLFLSLMSKRGFSEVLVVRIHFH